LIDAMVAHPILINRPIVVTPLGVKLCRPSEAVMEILPDRQRGAFAKEDGEAVVDGKGELDASKYRDCRAEAALDASAVFRGSVLGTISAV
jgi:hypothetical protein